MNMVVSGVAGSRPARRVSITDGPRKRTDQGRRLPPTRGSPALHSFLSVTGLSANADLTSPRTRLSDSHIAEPELIAVFDGVEFLQPDAHDLGPRFSVVAV